MQKFYLFLVGALFAIDDYIFLLVWMDLKENTCPFDSPGDVVASDPNLTGVTTH